MKRILCVLTALALALSCAVFGVQAAEEPAEEKAGTMYVPAVSFDSFEEGFQLGGLDDEGMDGEQKYMDCGQTVGIFFDVVASTNRAFHGMGINFKSINGGEQGVYVGMKFHLSQSAEQRTNFEGATDFVCYVDMKGWGTRRGVRPVLAVNGLNMAGELTDVTDTYLVNDSKPAYMQDENKNWVRIEDIESGTLGVPENYCGFVRVPISSFDLASWDPDDENGKLDLKQVQDISVELGCYAANDGNIIAVDEVGFLGDFEDGIPASFLNDGKVPEKESSSQSEAGKSEDKAEEGSASNMTWLLIVCGVVVVAAVVVIVIVVASNKKKKAASAEAPAEAKPEEKPEAKPEEPAEDEKKDE